MPILRLGPIFDTGPDSYGTATADMNGDGHLDLLVGGDMTSSVAILFGDGAGGFATGAPVPVGTASSMIKVGDLNGDGFLDFLNQMGASVTVALNNGDGTFATSSVPFGVLSGDLALGDLEGDGDLDLISLGDASHPIFVYLNDSTGGFTQDIDQPTSPFGYINRRMVFTDLDGDADLDLAVSDVGEGVTLLFNDGDGTLTPTAIIDLSFQADALVSGDVDADGDTDLVIGSYYANTINVMLNDGRGGFTEGAQHIVRGAHFNLRMGDLDGDGDLDLVVPDGTIDIMLNDGTGVFSLSDDTFATGTDFFGPSDVSLGDFDEDGDLDIAGASGGTVVFFNTMSNYSVSSALSANEGASGAGGELVFTITRTATSEAEDVTYTLGGSATSGTDYVVPSGTVSFIAGQKTAEVHIAIVGDSDVEARELVILTLDSASGEGAISTTAGSAAAAILIDDFAPNNAPVIGSANADLTAQPGTLLSLTIGDGHFTDADGNDLDYAMTVNGGAKPAWLSFDAETGLLTGAPTTAEAGTYVIAVTASDGAATSLADTFSLTITNPIAPVDPQGTKGDDTLVGDTSDNILDGRKGNDKLTGGEGADTFVLGKQYGRDVIKDFDPAEGDRIDLSGAVGITNYNDLMKHHTVDTGDHIRITADDGSALIIRDFEPGALTEDMFVF